MSGVAADSAVTLASGNAEIDALLWDRHWSRNNLTFSFPTGPAEYAYGSQNFGALLAQQATAANEILAQYSAVSLLSFAAPAAGTNANLRFARASATDSNIDGVITFGDNPATPGIEGDERIPTAYGIPPSDSGPPGNYDNRRWGDMWFNANPPGGANDMTNPLKGNYGYATFMHEIGHALGFDHPHGDAGIGNHFGNLAANWDSSEFTVMTYRNFAGAAIGANKPANNEPQSLMVLDIAALQYVYGANFSTNNGPTTYKFRPNTGNMEVNGVPENAATAPAGNVVFRTIWDGGGEDTYDLSSYGTNLSIDLRAASTTDPTVGWTLLDTSAANPAQRANLGQNANGTTHWAVGNIANARLFNGDVRSLIENATGGSGADILIGNNAANTLTGNSGADTLFGNDGPDRFEGGAGGDALVGGNGLDQAQYTFAASGVTVDLLFNPLNTGEAAGDTFDSIENLRGSNFNDILRGDEGDNGIGGWFGGGSDRLEGRGGNDTLAGGDGDDTLNGGDGVDSYDGGTGNDLYFIQDTLGIDLVFEGFNAGHDTVQSSVRWILGDNFEDLVLFGNANANGFGNALANRMTGNSGNNYLQGFAGIDTLAGGLGNDYYELGDLNQANPFALFAYDSVTEGAGAGIDTVSVTSIQSPDQVATSGYTLGSNIENGIIQGTLAFNLTGNALANALTGNTAVNTLTGGESGDTYFLTDLAKTQSFAVFAYDTVNESGSTGLDSVVVTAIDNPDTFASVETYTLGATIENGTIAGMIAFNLTGNGQANVLAGNAAMNTLTGGEGGDTYLLTGLARPNNFSLFAYDTVAETGSTGVDSVIVTALDSPDTVGTDRYTLGATIENGAITGGTLAFNLTGNGLANALSGNSGNNTLDGGLGDDTMAGGGGADIYVVDSAGDVVTELAVPGDDSINTFLANFSLFSIANVERLTFTGAGDFVGRGNGLDNRIEGGGGDDRFVVDQGGADRYFGGAGQADTVDYRSSATGAIVNLATGVHAGAALGDIFSSIERFFGSDTGGDSFTGSAVSDRFDGNAGADTLNGLGGSDTIYGGDGDDEIAGGALLDFLSGNAGADDFNYAALSDSGPSGGARDRILGFAAGSDEIDVSAIDARAGSAGNNAFLQFIAAAAFTAEGQVRWFQSGADTVIEFNTTGVSGAEMQIQLNAFAAANLASGDFIG